MISYLQSNVTQALADKGGLDFTKEAIATAPTPRMDGRLGVPYDLSKFSDKWEWIEATQDYLQKELKPVNNESSYKDAEHNCSLLLKLYHWLKKFETIENEAASKLFGYIEPIVYQSLQRYYKFLMYKEFAGKPTFAAAIIQRVHSTMSGHTLFPSALWEIASVIGCAADTLGNIVSKADYRLGSFAACRERFTTIDNKKLSEGMYWAVDRRKGIDSPNNKVRMPKLDKQLRPFERDVFDVLSGYTASLHTHLRGDKRGHNKDVNTDPQIAEGEHLTFALNMLYRLRRSMSEKSWSEQHHSLETEATPQDIKADIRLNANRQRYGRSMTAYQQISEVRKFAYAMAKNFQDATMVNLWLKIAWDAFKKGAWNIVLEAWELMAKDMKRSSLEERAKYFVASLKDRGIVSDCVEGTYADTRTT